MSVYAEIKDGDAVVKTILAQYRETVLGWLEEHWGEWDEAVIRLVPADKIKQGRKPYA